MKNEELIDTKGAFLSTGRVSSKHTNYFSVYDRLFSSIAIKNPTIVEIGIQSGGSLQMWRKVFGPNARVIGIDLNPVAQELAKEGFEIFIGDQASPKFWKSFFKEVGEVDIIIDDGGHTYEQQIVTAIESIPYIRDGGLLLVEDTHTSYMQGFGYPSSYTFTEWAKNLADSINARFPESESTAHWLNESVYGIRFYESIVCFEIDRSLCIKNTPCVSKGVSLSANDFRYADIKAKWSSFIPQDTPTGETKKDQSIIGRLRRFVGKRLLSYERAKKNKSLRRFFANS